MSALYVMLNTMEPKFRDRCAAESREVLSWLSDVINYGKRRASVFLIIFIQFWHGNQHTTYYIIHRS